MRTFSEETRELQLADFRRWARSGTPAARGSGTSITNALRQRRKLSASSSEHSLTARSEEMETLEADATSCREHSALRVGLAGLEERRRAERASMDRVEQQFAKSPGAGRDRAAKSSGWASERARLLSDNIELDRRSARLTVRI